LFKTAGIPFFNLFKYKKSSLKVFSKKLTNNGFRLILWHKSLYILRLFIIIYAYKNNIKRSVISENEALDIF
jgi:hypothetical protein